MQIMQNFINLSEKKNYCWQRLTNDALIFHTSLNPIREEIKAKWKYIILKKFDVSPPLTFYCRFTFLSFVIITNKWIQMFFFLNK